jgi:hypothetical protein
LRSSGLLVQNKDAIDSQVEHLFEFQQHNTPLVAVELYQQLCLLAKGVQMCAARLLRKLGMEVISKKDTGIRVISTTITGMNVIFPILNAANNPMKG